MTTAIKSDGVIELTSIDEDFDYMTEFINSPGGVQVEFIAFTPGSPGDVISIKQGADDQAAIFPTAPMNITDAGVVYYGGRQIKPYVDFSASTLSAGHQLIIKLS